MTPEQIERLGPAFTDYLQQFLFCCAHTQTFDLLGVYCRGLLSELQRKTCEPIALSAGVAVRTLQQFLKHSCWSFPQTRDLLQQHVAHQLPELPNDELGTVGLVDETGTRKKGTQTPGVQRQRCGELGKTENCIITVHVGVARGRYKTLIDADLYLPQVWDQDRGRCREAGIPDDVVYRPKWQIALTQIDRAVSNGVAFDWLTFDEEYGSRPGFLVGLDGRRLRFVGEVPKSFACFTRRPRPAQSSHRADDLARHSPAFTGQPWRTVRLPRQTLGDQVWQAKAVRIWLSEEGRPSERTYWLIWARCPQTGEEKYFVSNAPANAPLELLLRVGFRRWNVEHGFRLSKGEIGFRHFEGQNYVALMRHLVLCLVTLTFVAGQAADLRGEKCGGDGGASLPGVERGVRGLAGGATGNDPGAEYIGSHHLPPAA